MLIESDADRLNLLGDAGSGATLKYNSKCFEVAFDNDYILAGDVEERAPVATMRTSDFTCAELQKEAVVEVFNPFDKSTKDYRIRRFEPDGTGMTLVILQVA